MSISPSFPFTVYLMAALNGCASNPSNASMAARGHHPPSILISFVFYNLLSYMSGHQLVCPPPIVSTEMSPTARCGAG